MVSLGFLADHDSDSHFVCHFVAVDEQIIFALFSLIKQSDLTDVDCLTLRLSFSVEFFQLRNRQLVRHIELVLCDPTAKFQLLFQRLS